MPRRNARRRAAQPVTRPPARVNTVQRAPAKRNRAESSESSDEISMKGSDIDFEEVKKEV
jgi:hypothetical protein